MPRECRARRSSSTPASVSPSGLIRAAAVLTKLAALGRLGRPLLVGPSRKSFLLDGRASVPPSARDWGTAAAVTVAVMGGAHIVRVHNVAAMVQVVRVADALRAEAHA